jgi:hypothetical protein
MKKHSQGLSLGSFVLVSACAVAPPAQEADASKARTATPPPVNFATFRGTAQTVEGGTIDRVAQSERPGDAVVSSITLDDNELVVEGQIRAAGGSSYAGLGVLVGSPDRRIDASSYKAIRIRLRITQSVGVLRIRLVGPDVATQQNGCYPVVLQAVTSQSTSYRIQLTRFAPEPHCGSRGVNIAQTLPQLIGVEIVDAVPPVRDRSVTFRVGTIAFQP